MLVAERWARGADPGVQAVSPMPLSIECCVRGCNWRAGGLGDRSPPAGSRGSAPVGVWGETGFCALSVCILSLKHALKLQRWLL